MKNASIKLITGRRGSGKTTFLENELEGNRRLIVVSPIPGDFEKGYAQVTSLGDLTRILAHSWQGGAGFRIRYRPPDKIADAPWAVHHLAKLMKRVQQAYADGSDTRQITLAVDEANLYFPHSRPKGCDAFQWSILQGRHWGINIIAATQRPQLVSPDLRDNAEEWVVFPIGGDRAMSAVMDAVGSVHRPAVMALSNHRYFRFRDGERIAGENPPLK